MKYGNDNSRLTGMIEKAKSELEHMLDLNPQVMMLVDREGRILRANRALLSLLGEENFGSVLGRFVTEIFHCREGLDLAGMINGQAAASCRAEVQSGGLTRVLEFQIVGSGRAGDIFVVIVTDRTADKEFESYLEKRHKKEAVHELMGGLMHAINQPLTIIAVKSQLMDIALSRDSFDIGEFKSNLSDIAGMAIQISDMLQGIASPSDFVTSHYLPGTRIIDLEKSSAKRDSADVNEMVMLRGVLAALEIHDPGASGHGWRTGECAAAIAAGMGMGKSDVEAVQRSGVFHDIGKIAIPDVILQKPGPLTVEEWVIVKKHPETGHKLLSGFAGLRDLADAAYCHHERFDGSGYPRGMGGSDLSVVSRIIGLADAFDVMCSSRVYHEPARWGEAVAGISAEAGRQFDPDIVDVFKACSDNLREKFESQPLQDT